MELEGETSNETIEHRDKLERYLRDLFDKELVYKIDRREVGFIQDGIEYIVKGINRLIAFQGRANLKTAIDKFKTDLNGMTLVELPTLGGSGIETDILNIGSFYENTQNSFPNEFDFIYVLGNFERKGATKSCLPYVNESEVILHDIMKTMLCSTDCVVQNIKTFETQGLVYRTSDKDAREVRFEQYLERRDYSSRLQCAYKNIEGEEERIFVDIATGFRVTETLEDDTDHRCPLPGFAKEQFDNKSIVVVGGMVHFTEKEVHFMRKVLSKKHVKVYRIMKYLINGNGDYDELRKLLSTSSWPTLISTYIIKLQMIYHHYECEHTEKDALAPCILNMLEQLQATSSSVFVRNLSDVPNRPRLLKDEHRKELLHGLRTSLVDIRESILPYAYDQYRVTPIATLCLQKETASRRSCKCSVSCHIFVKVLIIIVVVALVLFACIMAGLKA